MAPKTKTKTAEVPVTPSESVYPTIEGFIETASADEVQALFNDVKDALGGLKGPRAETGKKAGKGVGRAEELLSFLLQVREKIEAERKGK